MRESVSIDGSDPQLPPALPRTEQDFCEMDEGADTVGPQFPVASGTAAAPQPTQPSFNNEELKQHFDTVIASASKEVVVRNITSYRQQVEANLPEDEGTVVVGETKWKLLLFPGWCPVTGVPCAVCRVPCAACRVLQWADHHLGGGSVLAAAS